VGGLRQPCAGLAGLLLGPYSFQFFLVTFFESCGFVMISIKTHSFHNCFHPRFFPFLSDWKANKIRKSSTRTTQTVTNSRLVFVVVLLWYVSCSCRVPAVFLLCSCVVVFGQLKGRLGITKLSTCFQMFSNVFKCVRHALGHNLSARRGKI
jgi:hypothetical protein